MKLAKYTIAFVSLLTLAGIASTTNVHAMSITNQHDAAVNSYPSVHVVNNPNVTVPTPNYAWGTNNGEDGRLNHMTVKAGATGVSFTTSAFFTVDGTPQSGAIVGHYFYTMVNANSNPESDNDHNDYIVRYDLNKVGSDHQLDSRTAQKGPKFNGGHGQSLAYNPRTHQLWFLNIGRGSDTHAAAELISQSSLAPVKKVNFKFASNGSSIDNNLAFDKAGNAYTYVKSGGGNVPQGAIKIYRGRITTSGVHFNLMRSAIRHTSGTIPQGLGYSPRTNRLYFVSDDSIISAPVSKLNRLSNGDLKYIHADSKREFEGLIFNQGGQGYLLTLRPTELMKMNGSF